MPRLNIKQRSQILSLGTLCAQEQHYTRTPKHIAILQHLHDIIKTQKWSLLILQNRFRESVETYNTLYTRDEIIDNILKLLSILDDVIADAYLKNGEVAYDVEDFLTMLESLTTWIHTAGDKHVKYEVDKGPEYFATLDESAVYTRHVPLLHQKHKGKIHLKAWKFAPSAAALLEDPVFTVTTVHANGSEGAEVSLQQALAQSAGDCGAETVETVEEEVHVVCFGCPGAKKAQEKKRKAVGLGPEHVGGETVVKRKKRAAGGCGKKGGKEFVMKFGGGRRDSVVQEREDVEKHA